MAVGGTVNINILYKNKYSLERMFNKMISLTGRPTNIQFYNPEIDETVEYTTILELFNDAKTMHSPVIFSIPESNLNTALQTYVYFNDRWLAAIISIPMEYIESKDEIILEKEIREYVSSVYKELPFLFAYCLHEHEIDIDEISSNYLNELLQLNPSIYFTPIDKEIVMIQGDTLLDGMTRRY